MGDERRAAGAGISRRALIGAMAGLGATAVAAGIGARIGTGTTRASIGSWTAGRGRHYFVAHRGAADVYPEHTIAGYDAALRWGALALEISTSSTADGVLICMHDLSFDRTTTIRGLIHSQPSAVLDGARVRQPQLGAAWTASPLPRIPLLEEVLIRYGRRVVLCIEAKRDEDYPAVMALVVKHGLQRSVVVKLFHASANLRTALASSYPVFAYLGAEDVGPASIAELAGRLDKARDYLVLPTIAASGPPPGSAAAPETGDRSAIPEYLDGALIRAAVATGVPVLVYPVHRRSEAQHYFDLGVAGAVSSSIGYVRSVLPPATADSWRSGAISAGELSWQPADPRFAPQLSGSGELGLRHQGTQHFLTFGQFCPVRKATRHYRIEFEARWTELPTDPSANLTLAFGHADDRYYEHKLGHSDGYHAIWRADGTVELFAHHAGQSVGERLAGLPSALPVVMNRWYAFGLSVTPANIGWSGDAAADPSSSSSGQPATSPLVISVSDARFRGGYLHLGRSSTDGSVSVRKFRIS